MSGSWWRAPCAGQEVHLDGGGRLLQEGHFRKEAGNVVIARTVANVHLAKGVQRGQAEADVCQIALRQANFMVVAGEHVKASRGLTAALRTKPLSELRPILPSPLTSYRSNGWGTGEARVWQICLPGSYW